MVNFFISRPIFATVLALLMLLVGGICVLLLPISLYPEIVPPQVQVTTTYTGADALTVADTVTTPIEQQINGVKGLIYFNSDSTSNGLANVIATFDVGYDQDIAAVDIQNKVATAQTSLPPEVKQYGVTVKKTSTNMVCVVNLISPDGRYDATFLDNYGQINVVDSLKRIPGVSDVNPFGRKYAMRVWLDPDRMANQRIGPAEVVQAIQSENKQAASGKIGSLPALPGQRFEYPVTSKGRLSKVEEFEKIVVRRNDDGSIVYLSDVARVQLDSENYETAGWLNGKPAGTIPIYQLADANAARYRQAGPPGDGPRGPELPGGPRVQDRLRHDPLRAREHHRGAGHAHRGVRPGPDRRLRVPAGLPRHGDPDDRDPGLARGHVRDDGRLRVLDQYADDVRARAGDRPGGGRRDHRRGEHREVPRARDGPAGGDTGGHGRDHRADRDHRVGAGGGLRPGGVHPGPHRQALQPVRHDDRLLVPVLGLQLADVYPGDRPAVPAAQARRDEVPAVPLVQPGTQVGRGLL